MILRAWVYARCSGEEKDTGQDVKAQVEQVAARCRALGYEVAGSSVDDGVSGDVHPSERRGFNAAFLAATTGKADFVAIREVSRFARCYPTKALDAFEEYEARGLRVLCCRETEFTTLEQREPDPTRTLTRFIPLWKAWADLVGIRTSTQEVMAEILAGRRSTKSGLPPGRPEKAIDPEHLRAAQAILAKPDGTLAAAHREVLRLRGYYEALDPATKKKRWVGRTTLARALGLTADQKPALTKTSVDQEASAPDGNGSDLVKPCPHGCDEPGCRGVCY